VNVAETLLVYLGVPLVIVLVMAALIFLPGGSHRRPRYRPGQPWEHEPIWYEPHPEGSADAGHGDGHGAVGALPHGERAAITSGAAAPVRKAGPLGGARGTW
jgi:hypothetical protein